MQPSSALLLLSAAALVATLLPAASAYEVGSQGRVMWENNCDFYGQDTYSVRASSDRCGDLCANDGSCTKWTWSNYNSGTCWLKSGGASSKNWFSGGNCGYVVGRSADPSSASGSYNNGLSAAETNEMLARINQYRAQNGAGPVSISATLMAAAFKHSQEQSSTCTMGHASPDGTDFSVRITNQGYRWASVSENVAAGQSTVDDVMTAWYNSPPHKKNLLDPAVTQVGFAKVNSACGNYKTFWTQDFAKPA